MALCALTLGSLTQSGTVLADLADRYFALKKSDISKRNVEHGREHLASK